MFLFIADIVVNDGDVVLQLDAGDEGLQQPTPEVLVVFISIPEGTEPALDLLTGEPRALYFCLFDLEDELALLLLEGGEARREATGPGLLDRGDYVPLTLTTGVELGAEGDGRIVGEVVILNAENLVGQGRDRLLLEHILDRRGDDNLLDLLLPDRLQFTFTAPLFVAAFVIEIDPAALPSARLGDDHRRTVTAETLTREKEVADGLPRGVHIVGRDEVLRAKPEGLLVDQRLGPQLDARGVEYPEVFFIPQHSIDDRLRDFTPPRADDPAAIQVFDAALHRSARGVKPEDLPDGRGLLLVDHDMPGLVRLISERENLATIEALLQGLPAAADHLLPEVGRVILRDALEDRLEDRALGPLGDRLLGIHELHPGPLEPGLIDGYILTVAAEAVDLPHDHDVEFMILSVPDHPLELETPVDAFPRDMPVGVYVDYVDPVLLREGRTVRDLSLDRLIRLPRPLGISGVNNTCHAVGSSSTFRTSAAEKSYSPRSRSPSLSTRLYFPPVISTSTKWTRPLSRSSRTSFVFPFGT